VGELVKYWLHILAGALLTAVLIVGCDVSDAARPAAEAEVINFHEMLNSERYKDIHQRSSPKFKEVTSEREMIELLNTIHTRLGNVRSSKTLQGRMDSSLTGSEVVLTQDTQFDSGAANETFTFSYQGNRAWLIHYKIDSPALVD
jgi:hypothetical protein